MESARNMRVRRHRRNSNGRAWLLMTILVLGFVIAFASIAAYDENLQPLASEVQLLNNLSAITLTPMNLSSINDTGYLALINRNHAISTEPSSGSLVSAWPTVPVNFIEGMYLHPTALQAVADMISTARNADVGSFFVSSGFRGQQLQAELYNNGANGAFALPPGHSEHHTGLAIDILAIGISQAQMGNSIEGRWLADNSYHYGLILRYPQGATSITGIEFEPWHFRYVGRPHAYYMMRNNLVLEEYIELIQGTGGISFDKNGRTHHVLHQIPNDGMIKVPTELSFNISRDNTGGFIITAWE